MIYIQDVLRLCNGTLICGREDIEISSVCTDSRKVQKGDIYVGIKGEVVDGSDYYREAIKRGAVACILNQGYEENTYGDCTVVVVEDTIQCLQELAKYKRSLFQIPVVAVTGSVGKTSCKDLIYSVLKKKYKTHRTMGNYNNHIGVPLTILGLHPDDEVLVVEMGMNHFREIALLSEIAKPTIAVITNVGTAHIGNLGSRENILKAKLEILEGMSGDQVVINQDNDLLAGVSAQLESEYEVSTISIDHESDYQAVCLREEVFDSCFDILGISQDISVQVGGRAYVYNALFAYAVGDLLGVEDAEIKEGIHEFQLSSSRLEKKVNERGTVIIDDTYNANYDSMVASLSLVSKVKDRRRIAILGDMLELGEYTSKMHHNLGDVIVEDHIDVLITVGEYSKLIDERALELGMDPESIYHFEREQDSYEFLDGFITGDDIVLIKGSHGIHLIGIVEAMMKFSN